MRASRSRLSAAPRQVSGRRGRSLGDRCVILSSFVRYRFTSSSLMYLKNGVNENTLPHIVIINKLEEKTVTVRKVVLPKDELGGHEKNCETNFGCFQRFFRQDFIPFEEKKPLYQCHKETFPQICWHLQFSLNNIHDSCQNCTNMANVAFLHVFAVHERTTV